jgi:SET domain-containing protein
MLPTLVIRSSSIHAAGCYTTRALRKGTRVCEYEGPRMTKEVADARYADRFVTYLFGYGEEDMVIDGFGTPMFFNHSCSPNCESEEVDGHIYISTLRAIKPGEELTYEYNLFDSDDATQDCDCGSPNCRKTMFSPLELKRRARLERAKTRAAKRAAAK